MENSQDEQENYDDQFLKIKKVEDQFYIMNDAIINFSDDQRDIAFNGLCHTLHERWNVKKCVLGRLMNEFGFIYTVPCYNCGDDYEWYDTCLKCD